MSDGPGAASTPGTWADYSRLTRMSPTTLLVVDVVWYLVLITLLLAREFRFLWVDRLPAVIDGVLPLIVPWAGALGGVTVSLAGLAAHWRDWGRQPRPASAVPPDADLAQRLDFNVWHLTRPLVSLSFGTFAALIVVLFLGTIQRTADNTVDVSPTGAATLMVIAFVVGYRERTFRELVERVVDTIVGPGDDAAVGGPGFELAPGVVDFQEIGVNTTSPPKTITLTNPTAKTIRSATLGLQGEGPFTVSTARLGPIAARSSTPIAVYCSPTQAGAYQQTLAVTVGATTKIVQLKVTATA